DRAPADEDPAARRARAGGRGGGGGTHPLRRARRRAARGHGRARRARRVGLSRPPRARAGGPMSWRGLSLNAKVALTVAAAFAVMIGEGGIAVLVGDGGRAEPVPQRIPMARLPALEDARGAPVFQELPWPGGSALHHHADLKAAEDVFGRLHVVYSLAELRHS